MKIGIRDLKARAPQVVREVRETGEPVDITYRGEVVARLTAVDSKPGVVDFQTAWKELEAVSREIGRRSKGRKPLKKAEWRRDV